MSETKLKIEDGTILNIRHDDHKRSRCWVAKVEKDMSQPGGLRREFLKRAPGGRVHLSGIEPGDWLEFAGDYYTSGGSKRPNRTYHRVLEINGDLVMEECEAGNVGRKAEAEPVNPLATYSDAALVAELKRRGVTIG